MELDEWTLLSAEGLSSRCCCLGLLRPVLTPSAHSVGYSALDPAH